MRGTDFLQCPLLRIILLCLFLNPAPNLYSAQDYIKENPELDRLLTKSSPQDRDRLNKMLSSMPAEDRQKFIQEMIDAGLKIEKNALTVETVFARFRRGNDQNGLKVSKTLPLPAEPLTEAELDTLARLPLKGILEIAQYRSGGVTGAQKHIRIILIMQRNVASPVEFALPVEGTLIIVQMDDEWVFIPKDYPRSDKTIAIRPGRTNKTDVDYDVGNGRMGSEVYSWDR